MNARAGSSAGGGSGKKCRAMFEPETTNISPSRLRTMMVAIFMVFLCCLPVGLCKLGQDVF